MPRTENTIYSRGSCKMQFLSNDGFKMLVAACVKYKYITTLTHTKYPNRIKIIMKAAKSICSNNQRTHSSVKIFFYLILIYCM